MGTRLHIVVSEELVARVDEARGLVPRSAWLRAAVEQALVGFGDAPRQRAHTKTEDDVAITPAPAEQPSRPLPHYNEGDALPPAKSQTFPPPDPDRRRPLARSSVQAKRDVRPVPKAGEK